MPSPFPGMDPYLEAPFRWPDFHARIITRIADALAPQVAPDDMVRIDRRSYTIELEAVAIPNYVEVRETYLEVREVGTRALITAIELLSPSNKRPGEGRDLYNRKRRHVILSYTNLVEIDLLCAWQPMEMQPSPHSDYRVLVRRGWQGSRAQLFDFKLRDGLPNVPIPLRKGEGEAILALGLIVTDLYDCARYDLEIDYREPPPAPPLSEADAAWLEEMLRAKGLRGALRSQDEQSA